jgi:hypothetical protein
MVYIHRLKGVLIPNTHTGNLIDSGKYFKQKYIWISESDQVGIFDKKRKSDVSIWSRVKSIN